MTFAKQFWRNRSDRMFGCHAWVLSRIESTSLLKSQLSSQQKQPAAIPGAHVPTVVYLWSSQLLSPILTCLVLLGAYNPPPLAGRIIPSVRMRKQRALHVAFTNCITVSLKATGDVKRPAISFPTRPFVVRAKRPARTAPQAPLWSR